MDIFDGENIALKLYVEFFSKENEHPDLSSEDWDHFEKSFGEKIYADILNLLTQLEFEPKEGRETWFKIIEHRRKLEQALGRDAGLHVAVCDYFINIEPILSSLVFVEARQLAQKERSTLLDHLTGLYNRRYLDRALLKEMEYHKRFGHPFSLLMLHVDHFEEYRDIHGDEAANQTLAELALVLSRTARDMDVAVRYGPEEFALVLPRCGKEQAGTAAERHRRNVEAHSFSGEEKLPSGGLTVTIGLAAFPDDTKDRKELVDLAEEAMHLAKKVGRNRVLWRE